jgi:threonine/homoserine/homoserine lactone efflux protein
VTGAATILSKALDVHDGSGVWQAYVELALGATLVLIGWTQWRRGGDRAGLPGWMQALTDLPTRRAAGLGFLLITLNPKNLPLTVAAGLTIGQSQAGGAAVAAVIAFTAVAGSTLWVPVLIYLVASPATRAPLDRLRTVLLRRQAAVVSLSLVVVGLALLIKGAIDR